MGFAGFSRRFTKCCFCEAIFHSFTQTMAGGKLATSLGIQTASTSLPYQNELAYKKAAGLDNQQGGGGLLDILKNKETGIDPFKSFSCTCCRNLFKWCL